MPPVAKVYHRMALPLAPGVAKMLPLPQKVAGATEGASGLAIMVMVTASLAAVLSHVVVVL